MYKTELLDKNATYSGLLFRAGSDWFSPSWWIQFKGQDTAKRLGYVFDKDNVPTHSFALVYEKWNDVLGWVVYESHFKTKGVHKQWFYEWAEDNDDSYFILAEDNLNVDKLNLLLGRPYGTVDMVAFIVDYFKRIFTRRPSVIHRIDNGLFCTEYLAICQIKNKLKDKFNLPEYALEPIHHWIQALSKRYITQTQLER